MLIKKIISGAQTGADQAGLEAAVALGLQTGGYCPKGGRTENGNDSSLISRYGLTETVGSDYPTRTKLNVAEADGTVWFGNIGSPGYWCTANALVRISPTGDKGVPLYRTVYWIVNPTRQEFLDWLDKQSISVLNVAGNRESTNPGIFKRTYAFLVDTLRE